MTHESRCSIASNKTPNNPQCPTGGRKNEVLPPGQLGQVKFCSSARTPIGNRTDEQSSVGPSGAPKSELVPAREAQARWLGVPESPFRA